MKKENQNNDITTAKTNKKETLKKPLTENDLLGFYGTEQYFKHWQGKYVYTEGVQYLAEHGEAYWLIDEIVLYQLDSRIKDDEMLKQIQFWHLTVNKDSTAVLKCERDEGDTVISEDITYTTFPLKSITLYVTDNVILLPSEY